MEKIRKNKRKDKGFSLVEVLLAVVLLGLVAAPLLQMFYSSLALNQKSKKYLAAADLAQSITEALSAQSWDISEGTVKAPDLVDSSKIKDYTCKVYGLKDFYFDNTDAKLVPVSDTDFNPDMSPRSPVYYVHNKVEDLGVNNIQESPFNGVYKGAGYTDAETDIFPIDSNKDNKRYCHYYYEKVNYGGFDFNVRIRVDLKYDLDGGSKEFYVVGINVYVYDYHDDIRFNSVNVNDGSIELIETVSTTIPNKRQ